MIHLYIMNEYSRNSIISTEIILKISKSVQIINSTDKQDFLKNKTLKEKKIAGQLSRRASGSCPSSDNLFLTPTKSLNHFYVFLF